jgi:uncharacterized protein
MPRLGLIKRLLPREVSFFDFFEEHCAITLQAALQLEAMAKPDQGDFYAAADKIRRFENDADAVLHKCIKALRKTFITPFDRGQIHDLIKGLDDVIDAIDEASSRTVLYDIRELKPEAKEMFSLIVGAVRGLADALELMRNLKKEPSIKRLCIMVHRFEEEGDALNRAGLRGLFEKETDPMIVIKWREIFDHLEDALDRCEDVADLIQGIIIEAS